MSYWISSFNWGFRSGLVIALNLEIVISESSFLNPNLSIRDKKSSLRLWGTITIFGYEPRAINNQNSLLPYTYFRFANLPYIIRLLFPFRYPMNVDTLIFGGIETNMCMWSSRLILDYLYSLKAQSSLNIFPTSTHILP